MAPTAHPHCFSHCEVIHFTLPAALRSLLIEILDLKDDGRFGNLVQDEKDSESAMYI